MGKKGMQGFRHLEIENKTVILKDLNGYVIPHSGFKVLTMKDKREKIYDSDKLEVFYSTGGESSGVKVSMHYYISKDDKALGNSIMSYDIKINDIITQCIKEPIGDSIKRYEDAYKSVKEFIKDILKDRFNIDIHDDELNAITKTIIELSIDELRFGHIRYNGSGYLREFDAMLKELGYIL